MAKKILLFGAKLTGNFGGPSLFLSTCKILRRSGESNIIYFLCQQTDYKLDIYKKYFEIFNIKPAYNPKYRSMYFGLLFKFIRIIPEKILNKNRFVSFIRKFDILIDIRGITQTDFFGANIVYYLKQNILLYSAKTFGVSVIKMTQDMGPFLKKSNKITAKFFLKRYDLIIARGIIVKELLNEIGISKNVIIRPDSAFILESAKDEELMTFFSKYNISQKFVAISCSKQVNNKSSLSNKNLKVTQYIENLSKIIDYIIEKYQLEIVIIPNERSNKLSGIDDFTIAKLLRDNVNNKNFVKIIEENIDAFMIKGIISKSLFTIASRYHSAVAALSSNVPLLVIGWGFKYDQLMEIACQSDFVIDHKEFDFIHVIRKIDSIIYNNSKIRSILSIVIPIIKERVLSTSEIINKY